MGQNSRHSKTEKTQNLTKLKNSKCDKLKNTKFYKNHKPKNMTKLKKSKFYKTKNKSN